MANLKDKHFERARNLGAKFASDKIESFVDHLRVAMKDESTGEFKYDEQKLKLLVGREIAMAYSLAYLQAMDLQTPKEMAKAQGKSLYIP